MDPNKEFKKRKHPYGSPRPYQRTLVIRCDNCGFKQHIQRDIWISDDNIVCPKCLGLEHWSPL